MGSLQAFEKLDVLEAPIVVLLGWSADTNSTLSHKLPPNLSTLVLTNDVELSSDYKWNDDALFSKADEFLQNRSKTPSKTALSLTIKRSESAVTDVCGRPYTTRWKELEVNYNRPGISFHHEVIPEALYYYALNQHFAA